MSASQILVRNIQIDQTNIVFFVQEAYRCTLNYINHDVVFKFFHDVPSRVLLQPFHNVAECFLYCIRRSWIVYMNENGLVKFLKKPFSLSDNF